MTPFKNNLYKFIRERYWGHRVHKGNRVYRVIVNFGLTVPTWNRLEDIPASKRIATRSDKLLYGNGLSYIRVNGGLFTGHGKRFFFYRLSLQTF
jgi:hypothetical protein